MIDIRLCTHNCSLMQQADLSIIIHRNLCRTSITFTTYYFALLCAVAESTRYKDMKLTNALSIGKLY